MIASRDGMDALGIGPYPKTHQWLHLIHGVWRYERLLFLFVASQNLTRGI